MCFPGNAKETTDPLLPSQASVHDRTRDIFGLDIPFLASLGSSEEAKKETDHFSWRGGVFFPLTASPYSTTFYFHYSLWKLWANTNREMKSVLISYLDDVFEPPGSDLDGRSRQ